MNSKTKIVVIHMKQLIIGGLIFLALLAALIFFIMSYAGSSSTNADSRNTKNNRSSQNTNSSVAPSTSESQTPSSENTVRTYTPGVYTASVSLDGNPVDVQVTVDKNNINSIELIQVSDAVTTMYPLLKNNFDEISAKVIETGSTDNIAYNSENKYTSTMLLNAIQNALDKCTVK